MSFNQNTVKSTSLNFNIHHKCIQERMKNINETFTTKSMAET